MEAIKDHLNLYLKNGEHPFRELFATHKCLRDFSDVVIEKWALWERFGEESLGDELSFLMLWETFLLLQKSEIPEAVKKKQIEFIIVFHETLKLVEEFRIESRKTIEVNLYSISTPSEI